MKCIKCGSESEMSFEDNIICSDCYSPKRVLKGGIYLLLMLVFFSCKKEEKCYVCFEKSYSAQHNKYFTSNPNPIYKCGSEKSIANYVKENNVPQQKQTTCQVR